MTSSHNIDFNG